MLGEVGEWVFVSGGEGEEVVVIGNIVGLFASIVGAFCMKSMPQDAH